MPGKQECKNTSLEILAAFSRKHFVLLGALTGPGGKTRKKIRKHLRALLLQLLKRLAG